MFVVVKSTIVSLNGCIGNSNSSDEMSMMSDGGGPGGGGESSKPYDYLLKFLLVGDSDVGKHEILQPLEDGSTESPFCVGSGE